MYTFDAPNPSNLTDLGQGNQFNYPPTYDGGKGRKVSTTEMGVGRMRMVGGRESGGR